MRAVAVDEEEREEEAAGAEEDVEAREERDAMRTRPTRDRGRASGLYAPPGSANGGVPTAPVTFRVLSFNVLAGNLPTASWTRLERI
jgi:hypothetical protein